MEAGPVAFETDCVIAGGGPAGMVLGYLLARAGVRVTVLEKHGDFLRDFRGDTIHPSTLRIMERLGLLEGLLAIPHQEVRAINAQWENRDLPLGDLSRMPTTCKFIALMPQWDFLDYLAKAGRAYPTFDLRMENEAIDLVRGRDGASDAHITGLRVRGPEGEYEIAARLVVACDGRHSRMRAASGLTVETLGAPMDVVWFKFPRDDADGQPPLGRFTRGAIFVMIPREGHWQCGYVIPKGMLEPLKTGGFEAFRKAIATAMSPKLPNVEARLQTLRDWNDVSLLSVTVDRLTQWSLDGFLCIGDAAHAMSPVGGIGINLAIQDAVATSNILRRIVLTRRPTPAELQRVQDRRLFPTRVTQAGQVLVQERVVSLALKATDAFEPPLAMRVISRFRFLQQLVARVLGMGVRPEVPDPD
jgi:2-polyprenyl-6-methoxyphenol hydroxylase-like FAD-dependent oxidoreductase